jgi:hypothetical protein
VNFPNNAEDPGLAEVQWLNQSCPGSVSGSGLV